MASEQVLRLSQKVEHVKASIYQSIHKEYSSFLPSKLQEDLLHNVKPILREIENIENKYENELKPQVDTLTTGHNDLVNEYQKSTLIVKHLETLCRCHKELSQNKNTAAQDLVKSAIHLRNVKDELVSIDPHNEICEVKIFKLLRKEYQNQEMKKNITIDELWDSIIVWNMSTNASWDTYEGHLKTTLKIDHTASSKGYEVGLKEIMEAMEILQCLNSKLKSFSQKIFTYLLKPLSLFQNLRLDIMSERSHIVRITKKTQKIKKTHAALYPKILGLVAFLRSKVFHDFYEHDVNDGEGEEKKSIINPLQLIGSFIWKDVSEMIIKDYLENAVPNINSQMERYESTIQDTLKFEEELLNLGFISEENTELSDYIKNVSTHFSNKVRQDILSDARDIMLSEIHNTMEVGLKSDRAAISFDEKTKQLDKHVKNILIGLEAINDEFLNVDVFAFPQCHVSENVQRLLDYVYAQMIKATESPFPVASQIFYSCRDIFELFVSIVPVYHKESLKLPQLSALHYNNCMYLAHHCITLGHQFRSKLPDQLNSALASFLDYVSILRKCGREIFLEQIRMQQKELLDILKPCQNLSDCSESGQTEPVQRSLNQVIHHLTRVVKQWDRILPSHIFKLSIGLLFNTAVDYLLASIFRMEDISVEDSGQIHALFSILIDRSPEIIQTCSRENRSQGITDGVKSWKKFNLLVEVLQASLEDIVDMWDSGKGELATCMTDGEVRHLMRALFQNTERRARAFAKIKYQIESGE